jgi:hypothetical protein
MTEAYVVKLGDKYSSGRVTGPQWVDREDAFVFTNHHEFNWTAKEWAERHARYHPGAVVVSANEVADPFADYVAEAEVYLGWDKRGEERELQNLTRSELMANIKQMVDQITATVDEPARWVR